MMIIMSNYLNYYEAVEVTFIMCLIFSGRAT